MREGTYRATGRRLFLPCVFLLSFGLLPSLCMSQITENLEIIFEKTYADGAPPDSLWDWGRSIDCAGDVNNDGYDDVIVAANRPSGDPLNPWLGKAYIFFGGDPMDTIPDVVLTGTPYGTSVIHVAGVGNFNGDEYDDVVVAQDDGEQGVKVFCGGDPMDAIPDLVLETRPGLSFADDVAGAGDVNGDSIDDCILGDYSYNSLSGRALVFFGGNPPDSIPDVVLNGHNAEGMGISVGGGGDLNGDGFDDVAVGADANSEAAPFAGKVYAFFGGAVMDTIPDVWIRGEGPDQSMGWYGTDIVRHSGLCDWLIVGSPFFPNGFPTPSCGKVYVLYGDSAMDTLTDAYMIGRTDSSLLGGESSWAGHPEGGGMGGILSCATKEDEERGATYLWLGEMPLDTVPDASVKGQSPGEQPSWISCGAGDLDGDARDEVMLCNYGSPLTERSVWIAKYSGTNVHESRPPEPRCGSDELLQNRPNPFSGRTIIPVVLHDTRERVLEVIDVHGSVVFTATICAAPASGVGSTLYTAWDGLDIRGGELPSGVYFVRLKTAGRASDGGSARKMILVRDRSASNDKVQRGEP